MKNIYSVQLLLTLALSLNLGATAVADETETADMPKSDSGLVQNPGKQITIPKIDPKFTTEKPKIVEHQATLGVGGLVDSEGRGGAAVSASYEGMELHFGHIDAGPADIVSIHPSGSFELSGRNGPSGAFELDGKLVSAVRLQGSGFNGLLPYKVNIIDVGLAGRFQPQAQASQLGLQVDAVNAALAGKASLFEGAIGLDACVGTAFGFNLGMSKALAAPSVGTLNGSLSACLGAKFHDYVVVRDTFKVSGDSLSDGGFGRVTNHLDISSQLVTDQVSKVVPLDNLALRYAVQSDNAESNVGGVIARDGVTTHTFSIVGTVAK